MKVQLTLKSGAQITVDVERMDVGYDGPADRVGSLKWKHAAAGGDLLGGVLRSEIAAIVLLQAAPPSTTDAGIEFGGGVS